jgi:hypothetical protein
MELEYMTWLSFQARSITEPRQPLAFIDWDRSATEQFDPGELHMLQIQNPITLAQELPPEKRIPALIEFKLHANLQKAALVARSLVLLEPPFEQKLMEAIGRQDTRELLEDNIMQLPASPDEYRTKYKKRRALL